MSSPAPAHRIAPQEFNTLADRYIIRTRVPREHVSDADILIRVERANLGVGDTLIVQCMDHDYTSLLYEAEYRVVSRTERFRSVEVDDRNIRQFTENKFTIARMTEWWASPVARAMEKLAAEQAEPADAGKGRKGKDAG